MPFQTKHSDEAISLFEFDQEHYLLAFRDSEYGANWLADLSRTWHKHKRTRELVKELANLIYVIPASRTQEGQVLVGEGHD